MLHLQQTCWGKGAFIPDKGSGCNKSSDLFSICSLRADFLKILGLKIFHMNECEHKQNNNWNLLQPKKQIFITAVYRSNAH
jgi:hypothetical protein